MFTDSGTLQEPSMPLPCEQLKPHSSQLQCELLTPEVWGQLAASGVYRPGNGSAVGVLKLGVHLNDPGNFFFV